MSGPVPVQPLTWNVAALLSEPPGSTRDYALAGVTIPLEDDRRLTDPIEGTVRFVRTGRGIFVRAVLATALGAECSRCLRPIEVRLALRIDEEVLPSIDLESGQPVNADADPDSARLTDHHELELETLVRDAIDLAEPIAPVCRADCLGLCPTCGERLDEGQHDHPQESIDPRLAALQSFRFDVEPQTE